MDNPGNLEKARKMKVAMKVLNIAKRNGARDSPRLRNDKEGGQIEKLRR